MPCFIIFIGGVIQVVIPVERGPVIVPVVGKKFFLTAIQGIEPGKDNVAQFELIPWLLGRCATVQDARTRQR